MKNGTTQFGDSVDFLPNFSFAAIFRTLSHCKKGDEKKVQKILKNFKNTENWFLWFDFRLQITQKLRHLILNFAINQFFGVKSTHIRVFDIFEDFHIIKSDESKNFSRYGLFEYIDEGKRVKNFRKNGMSAFGGIAGFRPNFNFAAIFGLFHIIKSNKSKKFSGYGLFKSIGKEKKIEKKLHKKIFFRVEWPYYKVFDSKIKNFTFWHSLFSTNNF